MTFQYPKVKYQITTSIDFFFFFFSFPFLYTRSLFHFVLILHKFVSFLILFPLDVQLINVKKSPVKNLFIDQSSIVDKQICVDIQNTMTIFLCNGSKQIHPCSVGLIIYRASSTTAPPKNIRNLHL